VGAYFFDPAVVPKILNHEFLSASRLVSMYFRALACWIRSWRSHASDILRSLWINTSAHGDHSYGNMYLPAAIRVIQHANARKYIETSLECRQEIHD